MSAVIKPLPVQRELDRTTIGCIQTIMRRVRLDLQQARLYARGNAPATQTIDQAGMAVRAALDVFEHNYLRGRM